MSEGLFSSFRISATGLSAQRRRLDVIAENLANAETTRTPAGGPYRRKRAVLAAESTPVDQVSQSEPFVQLVRSNEKHMAANAMESVRPVDPETGVTMTVQDDPSPFRSEYDPGHPDADANGYVLKPNVNVVDEMVDLILATRAYQANAVAFEASKDMFNVSLQI